MTTESGLAAVHAAVHSQPNQPVVAATIIPPVPAAAAAPAPVPQAPAADASAAAALSAKQRISSILKLEAARGREAMAQTLALDTDIPLEQAEALLKSAPIAAAGGEAFRAALLGKNPPLGTGASASASAAGAPAAPVTSVVKIDSRAIYERFNNPAKR
jgi:hypothetical protein